VTLLDFLPEEQVVQVPTPRRTARPPAPVQPFRTRIVHAA